MRVVVVGGTGNISLSIVRLLLEKGYDVTCFNRGETATVPYGAHQIVGDRQNRSEFEATMQREAFDIAIDMISFNREDAKSSLHAFRDVQQFIHCSTVVTYGIDFRWMPVTEDHETRPIIPYGQHKLEADKILLNAYYQDGFPVTIIKPSTTHGPKQGLHRQIAHGYEWIDRIRKGKPIVVCGDGMALHQFMHVDDAAKGFVGVIGKSQSIGQVYNLVNRGYHTWFDYHQTAMEIIGREVDIVGVSFDTLKTWNIPDFGICKDIFRHNLVYSSDKLFRDVPEFQSAISLKVGMAHIIEALDRDGRIPNSDETSWEDELIAKQSQVRPK